MKLFLPFLAIILCCSAQMAPYLHLTAAQIKSDHAVQALLNAGIQRIVNIGQAKHQFHSTHFTAHVTSVYKQSVAGGDNYKLNVNYTNPAKEDVGAVFQGFYNSSSNAVSIVSLTYKVQYPNHTTTRTITTTKTTTTTGPVTTTSPTTATTPVTPKTPTKTPSQMNTTSPSSTTAATTTSMNTTSPTSSSPSTIAAATSPTTTPTTSPSPMNATSPTTSSSPTTTVAASPTTSPSPMNATSPTTAAAAATSPTTTPTTSPSPMNTTGPATAAVSPTTTPMTPKNTTSPVNPAKNIVPVSALQTNQLLNELFNWGFNETVANSIKDGKIPNGNYAVKNVNSISETPVKNGDRYEFHCTATSPPNTTVDLAFIVRNVLDAYNSKVV